MSATMVKDGCGCGSGTPSVGKSSCGCGGTCPKCQGQAYTRPLFFSGQLLTEDDLRALVDYVVGKNRLHNRMLFGEGVVCGLLVTCDPCDCGKVVVQPGYALDCCGNDVVVECPVTLDINKMVHELRTRLLGADCGDPCAEKKDKQKPAAQSPQNPAGAAAADQQEGGSEEKHAQEYCLYIRYCEKPVEPVAPYATDDCSPSSCQNTRLKEGYSFELRCTEDDVDRPGLLQQVCECLKHKRHEGIVESVRQLNIARRVSSRTAQALGFALSNKQIKHEESEPQLLERSYDRLNAELSSADLPELIELLIKVAGHAARLELTNRHSEVTWDKLAELAEKVAQKASGPTADEFVVFYASKTASYVHDYFKRPRVEKSGQPATDAPEFRQDLEIRALAAFGPFVKSVVLRVLKLASALADHVASSVGRGLATTCNRNQQLATIGSVSPPDEIKVNRDIERRMRGAKQVLDLYTADQVDCVCNAINPSCPSCDDQSVLLACFKVRECCVEHICNLERDFVLTGPNVRYWLPVDLISELFEWVCCPEGCDPLREEVLEKAMEVLPPICDGLKTIRGVGADQFRRMVGSNLRRFLPSAEPPTATAIEASLAETRRELNELRERHEELTRRLDEGRGAGPRPGRR